MTQTQIQDQQNQSIEAPKADFAEAANLNIRNSDGNIEMLLDINMPITVTLGGTQISVRQLLQLCPGSVLKLDKLIDESAEFYIQNIKFATGDIVVVDGHFAIRIKEIVGTVPDSADLAQQQAQ